MTDEGLAEVVGGLHVALSHRDGPSCFTLEELNLANNDLTTKSLRALAPIIRLSSCHLKDLDLSGNRIAIVETTEADAWEAFLESFKHCCGMRRLVLSNNNLSGTTALEIFSRIYSRHPAIYLDQLAIPDHVTTGDNTGHISEATVEADKAKGRGGHSESIIEDWRMSITQGTMIPRACGLRSIPYIILSDIQMDDAGALWLSYVLENHHTPENLMDPVRPGPVSTTLQEYEEKTTCLGLVYLPNKRLSGSGLKLLQTAELVRQGLVESDDEMESPDDSSFIRSPSSNFGTPRSASLEFLTQATANISNRRVSISTTGSGIKRRVSGASPEKSRKHAAFDLTSLRKKIQRTTIEGAGQGDVVLWTTALKMNSYSRLFLSNMPQQDPVAPGASAQAIKSLINKHQERTLNFRYTHERQTSRNVILEDRFARQRPSGPNKENKASRFDKWIKILEARGEYRANENPGRLPRSVWYKIILYAVDSNRIMDDRQRQKMLRYGSDIKTLALELETLGKGKSHQIWHVLDTTGCLEYEVKS